MTAMRFARVNPATVVFLAAFVVLVYRWQRGSARARMDAAIQGWVKASPWRALLVGVAFTLVGAVMVVFADDLESPSRSAGSVRLWGVVGTAVGGSLTVLLLIRRSQGKPPWTADEP